MFIISFSILDGLTHLKEAFYSSGEMMNCLEILNIFLFKICQCPPKWVNRKTQKEKKIEENLYSVNSNPLNIGAILYCLLSIYSLRAEEQKILIMF